MKATNGPARVCIYTAICGGYDDLKPQPEQTIRCDFVCFTDNPATVPVAPWRVVELEPMEDHAPRLKAKRPKVLPHTAFEGYDITIWIDASIRILRPEFAEQLIESLGPSGMAAIVHPERDCIFPEAEASMQPATAHKYAGMPLRAQVESYREQGYPEHHGLLACGVIARDMRSELVRQINDAWWAEILRWSVQDQLSLPYVLWKLNARCGVLDINLWRNPLFEVRPHRDSDALLRNVSPAGIPERILPEDLSWAPDHLARYAFAAHWVAGRRVLDLCCGVGYGSNLLSAAGACKVFGVDISPETIDYAGRRYASAEFICADATGDLRVSRIDVVTCFEGIEHVEAPGKLLTTIVTALDPDGIAFISSPNGAYYPGGFSGNPYHVKEYARDEFASLLEPFFGDVELYFQWYDGDPRRPAFSHAHGGESETEKPFRLRPLPVSVLSEPECPKGEPLIWVALCRKPRPLRPVA